MEPPELHRLDESRRATSSLAGYGSWSNRFRPSDWLLFALAPILLGSTFLWVEIALRDLPPSAIALARISLATIVCAVFPGAWRARIPRRQNLQIIALGILWMGIPMQLMPIAQQWVPSSVMGMLNATMPIMTVIVWSSLMRKLPTRVQLTGVGVGLLGVFLIFLPDMATALANGGFVNAYLAGAAVLALLASACYGFSASMVVPLQQTYGAAAVLLRAQFAGMMFIAPFGVLAANGMVAAPSLPSLLALIPLGLLSSGVALLILASLFGRVGSTRGAMSVYLVPVVATLLGTSILGEQISGWALIGGLLILLGAFLASRRERIRKSPDKHVVPRLSSLGGARGDSAPPKGP